VRNVALFRQQEQVASYFFPWQRSRDRSIVLLKTGKPLPARVRSQVNLRIKADLT